jgi:hypothetical protein
VGNIRFAQEDAERLTLQILAAGESYTPTGKRIVSAWAHSDIKNLFE